MLVIIGGNRNSSLRLRILYIMHQHGHIIILPHQGDQSQIGSQDILSLYLIKVITIRARIVPFFPIITRPIVLTVIIRSLVKTGGLFLETDRPRPRSAPSRSSPYHSRKDRPTKAGQTKAPDGRWRPVPARSTALNRPQTYSTGTGQDPPHQEDRLTGDQAPDTHQLPGLIKLFDCRN